MNKKILLSVAAAATLAMTFTGCGSDNNSSDSASATTGTSGFTTLSNGTVVGASKGALSGSRVSVSGTTVTASGGTDTVSNKKFTGSVKSDTTITDSEDRVITNTYTNIAVNSGDNNVTSAFATVASAMGVSTDALTKVFQATADDAELENKARLLQRQVESSSDISSLFTEMRVAAASGKTFAEMIVMLNEITDAESNTTKLQMMADPANLALNPTQFANTIAAVDANSSLDFNTSKGDYTVTYSGLSLDSNVTTATITAGAAGLSAITDSNLSSDYMIGGTYDNNETGSLVVSISNLAEDTINSNASFAFQISNLSVSSDSNKTMFALNDNTSVKLTANSNMSVAETMTKTYGDVNSSTYVGMAFDGILINGNDINMTALINLGTELVGTESDSATDGNFTSGMVDGNFSAKVLLDVNGQNILTSDKAWLIGKDAITIDGSSVSGYKVLDANLTK